MQLDLNSVDSILAWWRVWPERHDSYLDYKLMTSPEFAHSILGARRAIEARPELRALRPPSPPLNDGWQVPPDDPSTDELAWLDADAAD